MIVTCASCRTRFRVAEEKVGPKGARIRCGRCQSVFVVRPPETRGTEPAAPAQKAPPQAWAETPAPPRPKAVPFVPALEVSEDDPFAPKRRPPPPPDPFAPAAAPLRGLPAHPFDAPKSPTPEPALDTSGAKSLWDPFDVEDRPPPAPGGTTVEPALREKLPPVEGLGGAAGTSSFGLSLEEMAPPPRTSLSDLLGPAGGPTLGATLPIKAAPPPPLPRPVPESGAERAPPAESSTALVEVPRSALEVPSAAGLPAPASGETPAPAPVPAAPAAEAAPPPPRARATTALANALSLALLLALAALLSLAWRGSLGPKVRALVGHPGAAPVVEATHLRAGPYETADGSSVLLVRGEVVAHRSLGSKVEVRVELLERGQVAASATALAGAEPTAEEVHGASTPEALAALRRALDARAAQGLSAGKSLPFAVVFPQPWPAPRRLELQVVAEPVPSAAP